MIKLTINNIEHAKAVHIEAILARLKTYDKAQVNAIYNKVSNLTDIPSRDEAHPWKWLIEFLSARFSTIKKWVEEESAYLKDNDTFLDMYNNLFANGNQRFVGPDKTYNAYAFLTNMDVHVCPYCEDEYLDIVEKTGAADVRTSEVDHFFEKSKYPLLAMSFYNLIPSGKACNQIKKAHGVGMSPYENDIESKTALYPDIPVGINMETLDPRECKIKFHAKGDMIKNVEVLALEGRYEHTYMDVYKLLKRKQQFSRDKLDMILGDDFGEFKQQILDEFFALPSPEEQKFSLHNKMKRDLLRRFDP